MKKYNIPFSPPDISEEEIYEVVKVLRSGWITSGPKNIEFEDKICDYCGTKKAIVLNSATAGLEIILKVLNIGGEKDEVITTPYTYTATASVIVHRGMKPVFVDVKKGTFLIDEEKLTDAITPNTRAIISVDIAGVPVDYDKIRKVLKDKKREDIVLISDSAHSFGASYKGNKVGGQEDFHVFSFHAVKNLTTAEGGAITFNDNNFGGKEDLYKEIKYTSLHGQSKDALSKMKLGAWKYDILTDGFKCNMPDIQAAIGIIQLKRYEGMLEKRAEIFNIYTEALKDKEWAQIPFYKDEIKETSYHVFALRIKEFDEKKRNAVIEDMAEKGIATNVHFIPLPMFTLYKNLGYDIKNYPNAYEMYKNEISLPVYSTLTLDNAKNVVNEIIDSVEKIIKK